ncbi:hypothetical protein [Kaistia granuli]|uniref:hypothetical protein n=1 Tax=Kaistia granuli TaxID=363259 RepID=UPI00037E5EA3|nr:hypothetical protein [Kaistia granuli]
MNAQTPTLDDIETDTHHLGHLLDALVENLLNVTHPAGIEDLSRAVALSIIARDMSEAIGRDLEAVHQAAITGTRQTKARAAA